MSGKRVSARDGLDGPLVPMATFRLENERVVAEWHNERYRGEMEKQGLRGMVDGSLRWLRPSDGALFFERLEDLYARSSMMVVELVDS